jgi:cell wall-associated NlpC family hydrolase
MDAPRLTLLAATVAFALAASPALGATPTGGASFPTTKAAQAVPGGALVGEPPAPAAPADVDVEATLAADGTATLPAGAPPEVAAIVQAANRIALLPYRYGGGHRSFEDTAYDCSGSVSYALHAAELLESPLDSTGLGRWGRAGAGRWISVYANKDHVFMVVAGLRFDTSGQKRTGSRWQPMDRSVKGFVVRHPDGL